MSSEREPEDATDDTPEQRRAQARREGVARGEQLQHSGFLDLVAVVVLVATLVTAHRSYAELGGTEYALHAALWIFGIRAFVRVCAFTKNT